MSYKEGYSGHIGVRRRDMYFRTVHIAKVHSELKEVNKHFGKIQYRNKI